MPVRICTNFRLDAQLPLDYRLVKANITERNAIPTIQRYLGMMVYVIADSTYYVLRTGIADLDWEAFESGSGTGGNFLSGSGAPAIGLGVEDDHYLDTATYNLYKKSAVAWDVITDFKRLRVIPNTIFHLFKANGNTDLDNPELGDVHIGFLDANSFGFQKYNGATWDDIGPVITL